MRRAGGTRHRARRTGAQWRELVERFERSGQTRGKFCAAHELALTTFDLWRRKLGATRAAVEEDHREALVVELTNPARAQTSATSTGTGAWEVEVELELGAGVVLRVRRTAPCGAVFRRVEFGCVPSLPTCGARGPLRSACRFAGRRNTAAEDADGVRDPKQGRSRHRDEHGDRTREHSDEQQDSLHGFKLPARWHDSADERARHTQGSARRAETTNYCVWRRTRTVPSQPLRNVYEPAMRAR